ncbi:MAG TPA: alpha-glucosidase MalA [Geobacterales bacterium]|nr:alpha-glucosidase MalA [Geobacterales bacterium]
MEDNIKLERGKKVLKITIGYDLCLSFNAPIGSPSPDFEMDRDTISLRLGNQSLKLDIKKEDKKIIITKKLGIKEKVLGFGEKALPLNKRRVRLAFWNYDHLGYNYYDDPLYLSIPFTIFVENNSAIGLFINSPAFCIADIGLSEYDKFIFEVHDEKCEIFVIFGPQISEILRTYLEITGKPFLPPIWALGYQISRYSYFPQDYVLDIAKNYLSEIPISALYLDIDYMDGYKIFTWNNKRFPEPKAMIEELHKLGIKVIPIIDPYIKVEEGYNIYEEAKTLCIKRDNKNPYITMGWPGLCTLPDFMRKETQTWWSSKIKEFVERYGFDGIWLDMNEPSVFNYKMIIEDLSTKFGLSEEIKAIIDRLVYILGSKRGVKANVLRNISPNDFFDLSVEPNVFHLLDNGKMTEHKYLRNAYPYFQAKATYEALKEIRKDVFILSRSGYAGIQKYAAIWTGDVPSTWEGLKLTLAILLNLSLSGISFCGCDLGGFVERGDYELIARWHQACAFVPFYRVHKDKGATEAEIYNMPSKYKKKIKEAIDLRMKFLPYLWHLCWKSHLEGEPIIRPLCYDFQEDEESYYIEDEYMVGSSLLCAPILEPNSKGREVYLPRSKWIDFWNGEIQEGPTYIECVAELPIFIRYGSAIPVKDGIIIFGEGDWRIYHDEKGKVAEISYKNNVLKQYGEPMEIRNIMILAQKISPRGFKANYNRLGTMIELDKTFKEIEFDK